ncbi:hypothetical protein N7340_17750 [Comamonas aquatica]|uniref:hypothetical protein n=1 Tax=Comamonas aquatica TaxID=225991 RepID=UPI00244CC878|nr:hypothetical protein [Comamonas aquatica]MDH0373585.1 hypothetical protein [Comamonas aquatica]
MSKPPIPTALTIAPRGKSFHGHTLRDDYLGLACRPKLDVCNCIECSPPGHQDLGASLAAPAPVDQVGGTTLPVEPPESDTLWQFLTRGYSLDYIRAHIDCGVPLFEEEARMLRDRAFKNWAQIRAEVGA